MGAGFEKIEKTSIIDEIAKQLINKIMSGEWKPGDKLPSEAELMEAFGTSKYAVRSVLAKLNSMGLVETRQGSGSFVCDPESVEYLNPLIPIVFMDPHRLLTVTEFRAGIEVEAAKLAALRATEEQITALGDIVQKMMACGEEMQQYSGLDIDFHVQVARASQNQMFEQSMNIIKMLYETDVKAVTDRGQLQIHQNIYEAIAARDPEKAAEQMQKHIRIVVENVQNSLEK